MNINDLEQDKPTTSQDSLKRASDLAERILKGQQSILDLEEKLKTYKKALRELDEVELPDLMLQIGVKQIKLVTGETVTIKDMVAASISQANKAEAFQWLIDNNHGDLIKNEVKLKFSRGEEEAADKIVKELLAKGLDPKQVKSVHSGTLSAFVKEQLSEGAEIPEKLLGVYIGRKAIIK